MTTQPEEQDEAMTMDFVLRPLQGKDRIIRQIMIGGDPVVLMQSDLSAETPNFQIDATGFDTYEELADFFEGMAEATRLADQMNQNQKRSNNESKES